MFTFTNPRLVATFDDWPSGRNRVKCEFRVETGRGGVRVSRRTTDKNGVWCKPKYTTYAKKACIVDGSDGNTYVLRWSDQYVSAVTITDHTCQFDARIDGLPSYVPGDHERYPELL